MKSFSQVGGMVGLGVLSALLGVSAAAKNDDEGNGGGWKPRVQQLEAAVAALQLRHLPVEAGVDCGSGGSIGAALAANVEGEGLLTINVTGTCVEAIRITRSNVLLKGQTGAVLQAPTGTTFIVNVEDNVRNVTISDLTIEGTSTAAVLAQRGAHVLVKNTTAQNSGSGVMALDNGVADVTGSILRANNNGAYAARGGVVTVTDSTLANNSIGVLVWKGGFVNLTSVAPDYSAASVGPVVTANNTGVVVRSGGVLDLADATIVQNTGNGIVVDSGGVAHFFTRLNGGGTHILGNQSGVVALRNSSLVFSDNTTSITSNVRGIVCSGAPSYIVPPVFTGVVGNTAGDIIGCIP